MPKPLKSSDYRLSEEQIERQRDWTERREAAKAAALAKRRAAQA